MTEVIDLRDGRWLPLSEPKRTNLAVETIDMAEQNVVADEDEISDAVLELVAEALAHGDEPRPTNLAQPRAPTRGERLWLELNRAGRLPENVSPAHLQAAHEQVEAENRAREQADAMFRDWTGEPAPEPEREAVELATSRDTPRDRLSREIDATVEGYGAGGDSTPGVVVET